MGLVARQHHGFDDGRCCDFPVQPRPLQLLPALHALRHNWHLLSGLRLSTRSLPVAPWPSFCRSALQRAIDSVSTLRGVHQRPLFNSLGNSQTVPGPRCSAGMGYNTDWRSRALYRPQKYPLCSLHLFESSLKTGLVCLGIGGMIKSLDGQHQLQCLQSWR
jgi:hypothetical protein